METMPVKVSVDVPDAIVLVEPAAVETDVTTDPAAVETDVLVTCNSYVSMARQKLEIWNCIQLKQLRWIRR